MNEEQKNDVNLDKRTAKLAFWSMLLGIFGFYLQFFRWGISLSKSSGFVLGLISLLFSLTPVLLYSLAIVFGIIALRKIVKSSNLLAGRGFAIAGLIISVLGIFPPTFRVAHYIQFFHHAKVVKFNDITSKTTLTLSTDSEFNNVDGVSILVTGYVDGSVNIHLCEVEGTRSCSRDITKGIVLMMIETDWYTDKCYFEYEPVDINSGHLTIRYVLWRRNW